MFAGWAVFGDRIRPLGFFGLVAGVVGVALIMGSRLQAGVDFFGVGLCVVGVIALTFATMSVRGASSGGNFLMVVGLQMLVGSVVLGVFGFTTENLTVEWCWQLVAIQNIMTRVMLSLVFLMSTIMIPRSFMRALALKAMMLSRMVGVCYVWLGLVS